MYIEGGPYGERPASGLGATTMAETQEPGQFESVMKWVEENPFVTLGLAVAFWYVFIGKPRVGTYIPRDYVGKV